MVPTSSMVPAASVQPWQEQAEWRDHKGEEGVCPGTGGGTPLATSAEAGLAQACPNWGETVAEGNICSAENVRKIYIFTTVSA